MIREASEKDLKGILEHSIYVHKDYRNHGIATKLMKEILKIASEREYATVVAGIDAANEVSITPREEFIYGKQFRYY